MFLVFFLVLWISTYRCTQSISAERCGNHGSPSELRSEIHMVTLIRFTSRERSHSFPHRETTATLLPFLSSLLVPGSGVCHVSQMRGSHLQIPMWLPCPDPEPLSSHRKTARLVGAIHQTRPTLVAVPLFTAFPVSYIPHLTQ
jgi:hypothetical protein